MTREMAQAGEEPVAAARQELGRRLAGMRKATRLSQRALAPRIGFSRSELSLAELGYPYVSADFWRSADDALGAGGALVAEYERIQLIEQASRESERQEESASHMPRQRTEQPPSAVVADRPAQGAAIHACPHCHQPVSVITELARPSAAPGPP
jgi:transcriptional regulator with XRE-family HTH domain